MGLYESYQSSGNVNDLTEGTFSGKGQLQTLHCVERMGK